jgi:hypothetical protein
MKYRKLRIAWSVAWGIIALLLCVLWVRSYSYGDGVCCVDNGLQKTVAGSNSGCMYLHFLDERSSGSPTNGWEYFSFSPTGFTGFQWSSSVAYRGIDVPFWFAVTVASSTGILPWVRRLRIRFSLRTLLIAMTLVAVGLGVVICMTG